MIPAPAPELVQVAPEERYKAAIETHKHYDSISISCVAGIIGILPGCLLFAEKTKTPLQHQIIFTAGILLTVLLYSLYHLSSINAGIARNVARKIHSGYNYEISTAYYQCHFGTEDEIAIFRDEIWPKKGSLFHLSMFNLIYWVTFLVIIGLILCLAILPK